MTAEAAIYLALAMLTAAFAVVLAFEARRWRLRAEEWETRARDLRRQLDARRPATRRRTVTHLPTTGVMSKVDDDTTTQVIPPTVITTARRPLIVYRQGQS